MGNIKEYLPIIGASFVSTLAVMVLLAMIQPRVFSLVPGAVPSDTVSTQAQKPKEAPAKPDSAHTVALEKKDSVAHSTVDSALVHAPSGPKSISAAQMADTSKTMAQHLEDSGIKIPSSSKPRSDTLSEVEMRKTVQIFESMDAESAAKILKNMDDYAIRQVIAAMNKRQSAKILATLEPKQAARILNGKEHQ